MPPITSTIILIESSFKISSKSVVINSSGTLTALALLGSLTRIFATSTWHPERFMISSPFICRIFHTPRPTLPKPSNAIFTFFN